MSAADEDVFALIGFGTEAVAYGIYIPLFLLSLAFLLWRRRTREIHWSMVIASCLLFVLCTAHFGILFNHFYNTLRNSGVDNFASETRLLLSADIILSLTDFIGDLVLLYRCWALWNKNYYVLILPFLTALAGFLCAMIGLGIINNTALDSELAPAFIVPLGTAAFALPLCTNGIVTILIVGRIIYLSRGISSEVRGKSSPVGQAVSVVVESGMIYFFTQIIFVTLFSLGHPAYEIVGYTAVQIYGIAPTLICFRIGLGFTAENTTWKPESSLRFTQDRARTTGHETGMTTGTGFTTTGMDESGSGGDYSSADGEKYDVSLKAGEKSVDSRMRTRTTLSTV